MAGPSTTRTLGSTSRPFLRRCGPANRGTAAPQTRSTRTSILLEESGAEYALILSGDHIYRMDYAAMLQRHHDSGADVTVACLTVDLEQARAFGVMTVDAQDRIVSFDEKPEQPQGMPDDPGHALASMGVYVFSMKLLASSAARRSRHRFQATISARTSCRRSCGTHHVAAYRFGGPSGRVTADRYWRDVGTHRCVLRSEHGSAASPCRRSICIRGTGRSGPTRGNILRRAACLADRAAKRKSSTACSRRAR